MEIERECGEKLDSQLVSRVASITEDNYKYPLSEAERMRSNPIPKEQVYLLMKDLLKGTELEKWFDDKHPEAAITQKRDFEDGFFISLRTGINNSQFVSFVVKDNELTLSLSHYLHNYSGYKCYCTPDNIIHENIGYGFGSWTYKTYNTDGEMISEKSKQSYGSCCD